MKPGIIKTADGHYCTECKQHNHCFCLNDEMGDPICDCGWPGYACRCSDGPAAEQTLSNDELHKIPRRNQTTHDLVWCTVYATAFAQQLSVVAAVRLANQAVQELRELPPWRPEHPFHDTTNARDLF